MHSVRKGFMPMAIAVIATGALLLLEPDFGAFTVIARLPWARCFWAASTGGFCRAAGGQSGRFCGADHQLVYRLQRVTSFMDPWQDPYGGVISCRTR